ncbi:MAG: tail fiber domain-containing protein [Paraclostridium sp.]
MGIERLRVSDSDPFFNASKWNGALEFSQHFENMIGAMLGNKFKGIYKPENSYEKGDYVWFNNECYIITDKNALFVEKEQLDNSVSSYYKDGGYFILRDNKINFYKDGVFTILNITNIDDFVYNDTKPYFFGYKNTDNGTRIYKIPLEGKVEIVNSNFQTNVKGMALDDFYGYVITEDNQINKFSLDDPSKSTVHENVSFTSNHDIVCIDVSNKFIYALNSNCDFMIINKDGGVVKTVNIRKYITSPNLAKFTVTDNDSVVVTNGSSDINVFMIDNENNVRFSYSMVIGIGRINKISYANSYLAMSSDSVVAHTLSSEYQLEIASMRKLISNISTIEIKNAILSLDFGRGQLVSNGETVIEPKSFSMDHNLTSNGIYNDGVNLVHFVGNRGIQLHGSTLKYDLTDLLNKVIICEFDSASNGNFLSIPVGGRSVSLKASNSVINGNFKTAYTIEENSVKVIVSKIDKIVERFEIPINGQLSNETILSSTSSVVLSKILIIPITEKPNIDFLLNCSYVIPDYYKNDFLPTPTNNKNGVRFLKPSNKSIINTEAGIKVNFSSDMNLNDNEIGLSTAGAKEMYDFIVKMQKDVEEKYSKKDHKHNFKELLEIPISALNNKKGIVSLSNSYQSDSESEAATPKAVKTSYDKAVAAENLAKTKLNSTPGGTDSFYLGYSAMVSGDVLNVFKTGKTGSFNGTNLSNAMPWGTNSWKYYNVNSHDNKAGYSGIVSMDFDGNEMAYTCISNGRLMPWKRVWSSANFDPNSKSDNHSHPYLSSNGGTLSGNLRVSNQLAIGKAGGHDSWITFDAQSNDPGYIRHHENNNSSIMFHSVSDDRGRTDYFSWGSTPGGNYSQCAYMYTDGYFHTDGDIHASGDITAFSDFRLKENIVTIENALDLTKQLNGVIFNRKDNGLKQTGLIAQDVLRVMPEAVTMNEEGYYSVNYGSLVGLLVESIKELQEKINKLENKK